MTDVAVFLLALVWFLVFCVYAIVTLPALIILFALSVGAEIRGDDKTSRRRADEVVALYGPILGIGERGTNWIRRRR